MVSSNSSILSKNPNILSTLMAAKSTRTSPSSRLDSFSGTSSKIRNLRINSRYIYNPYNNKYRSVFLFLISTYRGSLRKSNLSPSNRLKSPCSILQSSPHSPSSRRNFFKLFVRVARSISHNSSTRPNLIWPIFSNKLSL